MKTLRWIALALLGALLFGFAVGTVIRMQSEQATYYVVG